MTGQQLKNSILQMAVQGKLVPQDPNDEPASVLLERIRKEKEQLIKDGKIKKEKNPSYIFRGADNLPYEKVGKNEPVCIADEVPFEIPESWEWVRIGTVFTLQAGKNIKASDIFESNFDGSYLCYGGNGVRGYVKSYNREGTYPIIGRQGALCGNIKYAKGKFYATEHAVCVETFAKTNVKWACAFLEALNLNQYATATAQPGLAVANINTILIPLPPKNEQQRIVDILITLQPFIKTYTKKEGELQSLNQQFSNLLKKSILQNAVQGKLVPQNPSDEPASVLLEHIRAEKERLIQEGKIKRDKHESVIYRRDNSYYERLDGIERCIDDEIPFEIPENWEWVRLYNIASFQNGDRSKNYPNRNEYVSNGVAWINTGHITSDGFLNVNTMNYITEEKYNSLSNGHIQKGDLVYCLRGATFGKVARIEPFSKGAIASSLMIIRPFDVGLRDYIYWYLRSPVAYIELRKYSNGSAQPNLAAKDVGKYLVPIPPLDEQIRIVNESVYLLEIIKNI
ncbi:MAG: restriction endonuclease subunit S [Lachnospiraceae bacterium]|nr:restriction endonuclease subunit S [Lachnospiraceae bacterium]